MTQKLADLSLTGGKLVLPSGVREGTLLIRGGVIDRIVFAPEKPPPARVERHACGAYVLPGLIDSHVHFRTPGLTHKETWPDASRAAVAGGVTTVIDMPNTMPAFTDLTGLSQKVSQVAGHSLVDFAFHLGVTPDSIDALERADTATLPSVKVFMAGHNTSLPVIQEDNDLDRLFRVAARKGLLLTLHAEDEATLRLLATARGEPRTLAEHERTSSRAAALISLGRVIRLVERYGTRVHVLHVSSAEEVDLLEAASKVGMPISFEVTSHHLTFLAEEEGLGTYGKLRPALRTRRDQERLWQAILDGVVATIGSDHAPHTRAEKERLFADAPPGFPGVQELGPALLAGLRVFAPHLGADGHAQLLARLASRNPARLFGLARKGELVEGHDADVTVLYVNRPWRVTPASIHTHCRWSTYQDRILFGAPTLTLRRGRVVYDGQEQRFGEPDGKWLPSCDGGQRRQP